MKNSGQFLSLYLHSRHHPIYFYDNFLSGNRKNIILAYIYKLDREPGGRVVRTYMRWSTMKAVC